MSLHAANDYYNMEKKQKNMRTITTETDDFTLMIYQARCPKTIQKTNLVCQQQLTYPNVPHKNDEISYSRIKHRQARVNRYFSSLIYTSSQLWKLPLSIFFRKKLDMIFALCGSWFHGWGCWTGFSHLVLRVKMWTFDIRQWNIRDEGFL